jgi:hypothetical protein
VPARGLGAVPVVDGAAQAPVLLDRRPSVGPFDDVVDVGVGEEVTGAITVPFSSSQSRPANVS